MISTSLAPRGINGEGWTALFEREKYPEQTPGLEDSLAGQSRVVLWKVLERLIQEEVFSQVNTAPLFRPGSPCSEENLVVLRLLNWPAFPKERERFSRPEISAYLYEFVTDRFGL